MADLVVAAENPGPVKLPAWDDVIHIRPRPEVTPAQRAQLAGERRAGIVPTLDPAIVAELDRRARIAENIRESAVPEWRRQVIKVLTAADNVEDILSTAEWISRPLQAVIPGGRAVGRAARGTSSALDRIQTVLRGPSIVGRRQKSKAEQQRRANARTRKGKVRGVQRAQQWVKDNFGKLLEAGQAADTITGIGISLGGIFGALEEAQDRAIMSAWSGGKAVIALAAAAVPGIDPELAAVLRAQADESINEVRATGVPLIEQIERTARQVGAAAYRLTPMGMVAGVEDAVRAIRAEGLGAWLARAAGAAAAVATENPHYSPGDHAAALYVSGLANAPLAAALTYVSTLAPGARLAELPMPRTIVRNPVTRALLEDQGARFDARGRALGEWAEPAQTVLEWTDATIASSSSARATWLPASFREDPEQLLHALIEAHLPATALLLTGDVAGIATQYEPAVRAELMLHHTGIYPPRDLPDAQLRAWLDAQIAAAEASPEDYDERTWRAITARFWSLAGTDRPDLAG